MDLPKRYKPEVLRLRDEVAFVPPRYGLGVKNGPNEYGMTDGPFEDIQEALDIPGGKRMYIVRLPEGKPIYKWDCFTEEWVKNND